jgi:hypothetical protein
MTTKYAVEIGRTHEEFIQLNRKYSLVENPIYASVTNNLSGIDLDLKDIINPIIRSNIVHPWLYSLTFYFDCLVIEVYDAPYRETRLSLFITKEE